MNITQDIPQKKIDGKPMYQTIRYPEIPLSEDDIYVYTTESDRFDTLANDWYKDSSLWKIIAIANPNNNLGSLNISGGAQIRIPANPQEILKKFNLINL